MGWDAIVTAALIGSERQPPQLADPETPVGTLLAQLDEADADGRLLGAAAILGLYQQAGWQPATGGDPPPPCEPDELPLCSPRAAQHLDAMLNDRRSELLPEWLQAAAAAGRRVPEERLPHLLDAGRTRVELRPLLLPIIGNRGRWLARQNAAWAYMTDIAAAGAAGADQPGGPPLAEAELADLWETGTRTVRLALLKGLRQTAPARARDLLATTWDKEDAQNRAAFLELFEMGLSMDDEPLLEKLLDDRSKNVRTVAIDLLGSLPDSRLVTRMIARTRPLLQIQGNSKKESIEVVLPEVCDKAMQRDGIVVKVPTDLARKKLGERAWLLQQMLGFVPPTVWCDAFQKKPAEILALTGKSEWKGLLRTGWEQATLRSRDIAWAEALLTIMTEHAELIGALPPERAEALLIRKLRPGGEGLEGARRLLEHYPHPWSADLSRAVIEGLRSLAADPRMLSHGFSTATPLFARRIAPEMIDEAIQALADANADTKKHWRYTQAIDTLTTTLQVRRDMLAALQD